MQTHAQMPHLVIDLLKEEKVVEETLIDHNLVQISAITAKKKVILLVNVPIMLVMIRVFFEFHKYLLIVAVL